MELDDDTRERIRASVDAGFDAQTAFTAELVAFRSERGAETAIQQHIHDALAARGYALDRFDMDPDAIAGHPGGGAWSPGHSRAPIVVGTHRPTQARGRSLILQSHVDVVPAGPASMWRSPPYEARIEGDWMYGRGAADMKAGAAANLFALDALGRIGLRPAAPVHVLSVVEEESTGNGALMAHLRGYRAEAALIPEPEDEMLVRANTGVLWFTVAVAGAPAHVREMGTGANAIDAAYRIVGALREMEEAWNARRGAHVHFADLDHPINLNVGRIEGGDWASSVPCWCRVACRVATYPGTSAAAAAEEIRARIAGFAKADPFLNAAPPEVTFDGFLAEGYVLEPGSEAEAALGRAHVRATGETLRSFTTPGYLDARVHALYDRVPALCYGPHSRNIHGFDEAVSLTSVRRVTQAMALFVADWCGLEPMGDA